MTPTSLDTFAHVAPEIALVAAALATYLGGAFLGLRRGWLVALAGIGVAFAIARFPLLAAGASGGVVVDPFSTFVRHAVLALGALVALVQSGDLFSGSVTRGPGMHRGGTCEEAGTFLVLLAGLSLVGCAGDLVLLFAGLELVSIPTYVLLALKRIDGRGQEAALKYFFLSLVASAFFLYAVVCLYGIGGSTNLATIADRLQAGGTSTDMALALVPAALGLAAVGAAFRLAAVPMHFYAPDVYEGTGPGNAALLSTLPKVAGLVLLARIVALGGAAAAPADVAGPAAVALLDLTWQVTAVLAAVTMTVGNVMALWQRNLRRLLACSSIAHAGYLLVGVAAAAAAAATRSEPGQPADGGDLSSLWSGELGGMSAALFYLVAYAPATIGVFGALAYLGHRWPEWTSGDGPRPPREEIATVDDLDGLSTTNPVVAFAIALFLLSLAGIPPLPGFWGKLSLALAALEVDWAAPLAAGGPRAWFVGLAVVLVVNAAIAAAYYLRIIAAMYFKATKRPVQSDGGLAGGLAMLACLAILAVATVRPQPFFDAASRAGAAVSGTPRTESSSRGTPPGSSTDTASR